MNPNATPAIGNVGVRSSPHPTALLADALIASLPGGTVDALLVELMRRKVSLWSVPMG